MPADVAALLSEAPWLVRLARSLTGDRADADDAVQETYSAALRSPPDDDRPLRPWLRRVLQNAIRMRHRGAGRRAANEAVTELAAEPVRTPEQLLERAQLEQRLGERVLALPEPGRTTVLLRYREGLTAEQIAQQLGIPAATVRGRLKTALDRLRADLDERDTARWRALLAPVPFGRILMAKASSKLVLALALLVLLLGGLSVVMWKRHGETSTPTGTATPIATTTPKHDVAVFAQAGVAARALAGRVTFEGKPFAGAAVRLVHAGTRTLLAETTSAADGTFALGARPADVYMITAAAPAKTAAPVRVDLRAPAAPSIELRLVGCSVLRGSVVDGAGTPIVRARVARADAPWPFADTDASGHYELCTRFGSADYVYAATGYQSVVLGLDIDAATTRDVVLIPEAVVAGTVVAADGTPVENAWITIDPIDKGRDRNGPARGSSEHDGAFRIAGIAPGRNFISAVAAGRITPHRIEIVVGAGEVREGLVLRLGAAATITGTVVANGVPVAGAPIGMKVGNKDVDGWLAVTQANGSFAIDRAPRGDVALYVDGYTVIEPRSVRIAADSTAVRVEVEALGQIRGHVVPPTDAQVACPHGVVIADLDGAYACRGIEPGTHEVAATTPAGRWGAAHVTVERGGTAQLDVPLTYSAAICGSVVDDAGAPVASVEVRVNELTSGDFGKDTTGRDGRFCARFLTGGTYQATVLAGAQRLAPPVQLAPIRADERAEVKLVATPPRLAIAGAIADPQGAPIADAIVRLVPATSVGARVFDSRSPSTLALTDANGRFELTRLAAGNYTLLASARDGSETTVPSVAAGTRDLAVTLDAAGQIAGTLVGFAAPPTITGLIMTGSHNPIDAEVDGDRFHATGLSPGTYVLMAVTDGHEGDTQEVVVRAGQTATVTMTSRGVATVEGVVREWRTREPRPGVRCSSATRQGDAIGAIYNAPDTGAIADARGAFRFDGPAGEIVVSCSGAGADGMRRATVPRDRTSTVDVLVVTHTRDPGTIDARFAFLTNRIADLTKGGPAERAGLQVGDEVIAVDGASVTELATRETMYVITARPAGATAALTVKRGDATLPITVTVRAPD